jgi:kynurenine formamidase
LRTRVLLGHDSFDLDLADPIDLAQEVRFDGNAELEQPFGAPAPQAEALRVRNFVGDVALGGSCNCFTQSFTAHTSGTHSESAAHLTREPLDAWRVLPTDLLPCVLLHAESAPVPERAPQVADGRARGDDPGARPRVITAAALEAAWPTALAFPPLAAVIGSGTDASPAAFRQPPYFSPDAMRFLLERGILHLVVDLPSLDPREDGGALAAHRVFFGMPPRSTALREATRPRATVTELARVPRTLAPGSYLLMLQAPAIAGDAVPCRPLLYRTVAATTP